MQRILPSERSFIKPIKLGRGLGRREKASQSVGLMLKEAWGGEGRGGEGKYSSSHPPHVFMPSYYPQSQGKLAPKLLGAIYTMLS